MIWSLTAWANLFKVLSFIVFARPFWICELPTGRCSNFLSFILTHHHHHIITWTTGVCWKWLFQCCIEVNVTISLWSSQSNFPKIDRQTDPLNRILRTSQDSHLSHHITSENTFFIGVIHRVLQLRQIQETIPFFTFLSSHKKLTI